MVVAMSENSQCSSGTERTDGDERMAVISGWAGEVDDRHSMKGAGAGYSEELYTPPFQTGIGFRSLQADTNGEEGGRYD